MRIKWRVVLLPLFFLLPSCGPGDAIPIEVTVRDSAGITIIENSMAALINAPRWTLAPTPTLELGELNGPDPYQFVRIHGTRLMGDRIWVLDGGTDELRAFGLDGVHQFTTGGSGEGPGEFTYPLSLLPLEPDTLLVWDNRGKRISYFNTAGEFLRSVSVLHAFMNPSLVAPFSDGSFLFRDMWLIIPSSPGIEEAPLNLLRIGADGRLLDSLGTFPGGQMAKVDVEPGFAQVAFSNYTALAGDRESFWLGVGAEPEIQQRGPDGEILRIIRWESGDREVRQEDADAFFENSLAGITDEDRRRSRRRVFDVTPVAERFPTMDALHLDRAGRIWVREYHRPRDEGPNRWMVFSSSGESLARMEIPEGIHPFDFGEDYILGRTHGEFDEQYIHLYEIQRSPGGR